MDEKNEPKKKTALTAIKDFISVSDCRALLAVITVIGGMIIIALSMFLGGKDLALVVVPSVVALITIVLEWYFRTQDNKQEIA